MSKRIWALILGLIVNALGNGLTVATNLGTSPWTAAEVNVAHLLGTSVGWPMFVIGSITAVINQLLIRHWDPLRFFGELAFISGFSYFVDVFLAFFVWLGVPEMGLVVKVILCLVGVFTFCCAISLYQRANLVMHPNDDTTNILRFLYFHDRVVVAQSINFAVPMAIMAVTVMLSHQIYSFNIGTIVCVLFNGSLINFADRFVWPSLHHNFRVSAH